jgi:membrane protein required for colicin V production
MSGMNGADWCIAAVLLISIVQAAIEGFTQVAFGIGGIVLGYLVAMWQFQRVANVLSPYLKSPWAGEIVAFVFIFLAVMVLAGIAGRIARWAAKEAGLSVVDRLLGALLGVARGVLMVAVILMGMTAFTPTSKYLEGSQFAPYFLVVGRAAIWLGPTELRARFYQGLDLLHQAKMPPVLSPPQAPHN